VGRKWCQEGGREEEKVEERENRKMKRGNTKIMGDRWEEWQAHFQLTNHLLDSKDCAFFIPRQVVLRPLGTHHWERHLQR
jgi:hypothetical protein